MSCSFEPQMIGNIPSQTPWQSTRYQPGATRLAEMTTIGVGGPVSEVIEATSRDEIIAAVKAADAVGCSLLVIGGGSNILASDAPFNGVVVRDMRTEITPLMDDGCGGGQMRATAGTSWDELVVFAIEHEWMGLEALSGIPGSAGAAPVQNIGAYGQELAETFASLTAYDRQEKKITTLFLSDLEFGYRDSVLKRSIAEWGPTPRWVVLDVTLHMRRATLSRPIAYGQLANALGVEIGERVPSWQVRKAVLELRQSKGMVLDDADRDTFSLGSFFTNPILSYDDANALPEDAPRYPVTKGAAVNQIDGKAPVVEDRVKTSAAWLIEHAGFSKGFSIVANSSLSTKHTLALTNRGEATGEHIRELARHIQGGVEERFGVHLEPEPVVLGGGL